MATQTLSLTQSLFDHRHLGRYGYAPVQWLSHQVFYVSSPAQKQGTLALFYTLCDAIMRIFYAFLMILALIPAAIGLAYNFCAALYDPLPVIKHRDPTILSETDSKLKKIVDDFSQIEADFRQVFENLDLLKGDKGAGLEERFNALAESFEHYTKDVVGKTYFKLFTDMRVQYTALRAARVSLFYVPSRLHEQSLTIPVSDKGNCLYEAVAQAIDLYGCRMDDMTNSSVQYQLDPAQLRQDTVTWETQNVDTDRALRTRILGAIATYLFVNRTKIEEYQATNTTFEALISNAFEQEQLQYKQGIENNRKEIARLEELCRPYQDRDTCIRHYLEQAAKPGVWGTEAELYAMAQMFQMGISVQAVKREEQKIAGGEINKIDTHCPEYDVKDLFPDRLRQMKLKNINGVHYEPLIKNGNGS